MDLKLVFHQVLNWKPKILMPWTHFPSFVTVEYHGNYTALHHPWLESFKSCPSSAFSGDFLLAGGVPSSFSWSISSANSNSFFHPSKISSLEPDVVISMTSFELEFVVRVFGWVVERNRSRTDSEVDC